MGLLIASAYCSGKPLFTAVVRLIPWAQSQPSVSGDWCLLGGSHCRAVLNLFFMGRPSLMLWAGESSLTSAADH
jgi:hypothetical protein